MVNVSKFAKHERKCSHLTAPGTTASAHVSIRVIGQGGRAGVSGTRVDGYLDCNYGCVSGEGQFLSSLCNKLRAAFIRMQGPRGWKRECVETAESEGFHGLRERAGISWRVKYAHVSITDKGGHVFNLSWHCRGRHRPALACAT